MHRKPEKLTYLMTTLIEVLICETYTTMVNAGKVTFLAVYLLTENCTCKTRKLDCIVLLLSKIDQNGVFSLVHLKHFEAKFYCVVLRISFSNFQIINKYYLLLKQLILTLCIISSFICKNIIPLRNDIHICIYCVCV